MRNIRYIGTDAICRAFFHQTGIVWTPGKVDTVLDDRVAAQMLKYTAVFQDAGDATASVGALGIHPSAGLLSGGAALTPSQRAQARSGLGIAESLASALADSVISHRGGAEVAAENAMSAYKNSMICGLKHIEQDVHVLVDGSLACMHDATADATTTGTGPIAGLTGAQFKALEMDPANFLAAPSMQPENPPLFDEVVQELGASNCVFWPEAKSAGTCAGIVAAFLRHNIPRHRAVVQSFTQAELLPAIRAGYGAAFGANPATADWAALRTYGITHVFWNAWTAPQCAAAKAAGISPVVYTINRRVEWDAFRALGVDFVFSNDPLWTSRLWVPQVQDSYRAKRWMPGMLARGAERRGVFLGANEWGYSSTITAYLGCLQGWACPVKNDDNCDSYTITLSVELDLPASADRWAGFYVCCGNDSKFEDEGAGAAVAGYHALLRANGVIQIYRQTPGSAALLLGSFSGTALVPGTKYSVQIVVTPTQITLANLTNSQSCTVTDSAHRGGYFHFGRSGVAAKFSDVIVS